MAGDRDAIHPSQAAQSGLRQPARSTDAPEGGTEMTMTMTHVPHCSASATFQQVMNVAPTPTRPTVTPDTIRAVSIDPKEIGGNIRRMRAARGLTQEGLAEAATIDRVTLAKIESGERKPSVETLFKVAQALDVSTSVLIGDVPVGTQSPEELVERFAGSPYAQILQPPATEQELAHVRRLAPMVWSLAPADERAVYHLILSLRQGE